MSEYNLEIKQIVDYPRCGVYREFVQFLISDPSIRVNGHFFWPISKFRNTRSNSPA